MEADAPSSLGLKLGDEEALSSNCASTVIGRACVGDLAIAWRAILRAFAVTALALSQTHAVDLNDARQSAEPRIAAIEKRIGGRLGVAAYDSGSKRHIAHRADERFPFCSTCKVLAVAAVLKRVDEQQEQLSRFVPYREQDLLEYAPVTRQHVKNGGMTVAALCEAAITISDNTAANLLVENVGGPEGLTRYARSLGDEKTRPDRLEPDLNDFRPGEERDTTTPAAMVVDLQQLLLGDQLSRSSRQKLENWLAENKTGLTMIRAGVPRGWKVGDKTGRGGQNATNDIAILWPPGKPPILLAIYCVESKVSSKNREAAIAEVARIVAGAF